MNRRLVLYHQLSGQVRIRLRIIKYVQHSFERIIIAAPVFSVFMEWTKDENSVQRIGLRNL